eukprot:scaffold46373_cov153-Skeletonema_marinoi.AAC.1
MIIGRDGDGDERSRSGGCTNIAQRAGKYKSKRHGANAIRRIIEGYTDISRHIRRSPEEAWGQVQTMQH